MSTATLVMGPPYSGKSTYLKKFSDRKDLVLLSPGSVYQSMTPVEKGDPEAVWWGKGGVVEQVVSALERGFDVAVEGTFKERALRVRLIQEIRRRFRGARVEGVFLEVSSEEIEERFNKQKDQREMKPGAWQRVRRTHKAMKADPPGVLDGFDKLFIVNAKSELVAEKTLPEEPAGKIEVRRFT